MTHLCGFGLIFFAEHGWIGFGFGFGFGLGLVAFWCYLLLELKFSNLHELLLL